MGFGSDGSATKAITTVGFSQTATRPPTRAPRKIVTNGGNRRTAKTKTNTRGRKDKGETWKCWSSPRMVSDASKSPRVPSSANRPSATPSEGTDVHKVSRICADRSDPVDAVARLTVSESGEALSPKYAPEITAPAVIAGDRPMFAAIPIRPMPIVPTTVQELPMQIATTAHRSAADA